MSDHITRASDLERTADINVERLSYDCLSVDGTDFDFSSGWGSNWEFRAAAECEDCEGIFVGDTTIECENAECPSYGEPIEEDNGPMMNYYYALGDGELDDDGVRQLVGLPLCYVEIEGRPALALTGGGMDLSWEICEAFMRLGFLPPIEYAALPAMCGRGNSDRDKAIMAACRRTAQASYDRGERGRHRILGAVEQSEALGAEEAARRRENGC